MFLLMLIFPVRKTDAAFELAFPSGFDAKLRLLLEECNHFFNNVIHQNHRPWTAGARGRAGAGLANPAGIGVGANVIIMAQRSGLTHFRGIEWRDQSADGAAPAYSRACRHEIASALGVKNYIRLPIPN
jgi:hypothetical protein